MTLLARHLMEPDVVSVSPDDPLGSVQRMLFEEGIHGAPVVEEDGQVVGVISSLDLLQAAVEDRDSGRDEPHYARELLEGSSPGDWAWLPSLSESLSGQRVAEFMSSEIVSVAPETPIPQVAAALRTHRVHRVLVLEDGRLEGIISTFDLVALLEKGELAPTATK